MSPYVAAGAFFFQKNGPWILGVTHKWIWIWIYPVCDSMEYPVNKGEGSCMSHGFGKPVGEGCLGPTFFKKYSKLALSALCSNSVRVGAMW